MKKNFEVIEESTDSRNNMVFKYGESYFYADKTYVPFTGNETMIFICEPDEDEKGKFVVPNWTDLYCDRTGQSLNDCINEFIERIDNEETVIPHKMSDTEVLEDEIFKLDMEEDSIRCRLLEIEAERNRIKNEIGELKNKNYGRKRRY